MEPVGDANITNVLIYRNPKFPDLLISAEEDGCFRKGGAISQSAFDLQFLAP
jgi:hypothetical protein